MFCLSIPLWPENWTMRVEVGSSEAACHLGDRETGSGIQMLTLPLASSVVMGKLFNFAIPQFPHF